MRATWRVVLSTVAIGAAAVGVGPLPSAEARQPEGITIHEGIKQIATGLDFACFVDFDTEVRCWGGNEHGELGRGDTTPYEGAISVQNATGTANLSNVTQVTVGDNHACALLTNGQVRCWGSNSDRQLGNGSTAARSTRPVAVRAVTGAGNLTNVRAISAEARGTCALLHTGQVRCWGDDDFGQLGDGAPLRDRGRPVVVRGVGGQGALTAVTQLDSGWDNTCARLSNGQARCWGYNGSGGALGNGSTALSAVPVVVKAMAGTTGPLTGVTQVSAGGFTSCARLGNGQARCWGRNDSGQLGNNSTSPSRRPTPVMTQTGTVRLQGVSHLYAGIDHTCARMAGTDVRCWGSTVRGQVGDDTIDDGNRPLPVKVIDRDSDGSLVGVADVRTSAYFSCARLQDRRAVCWGANDKGQMSTSPGGDRPRPDYVVT